MRIRPPSPPRRAVAALAAALLALAVACTPGGSDDAKSSSSGPVTLKLQANAVKGGKNATEATWLQDWVIPNFQKMMADQGKQVTVQYVGTGADDEDVKTQLALDLRTGAGPDVFTPDGPWVGEFAQAGFLKPLDQVTVPEGRQPAVGDHAFLVPDPERLLVYRAEDGELVGAGQPDRDTAAQGLRATPP
jgi:ABC-type glycerol-3-phosphate transport system substrate-binding protein